MNADLRSAIDALAAYLTGVGGGIGISMVLFLRGVPAVVGAFGCWGSSIAGLIWRRRAKRAYERAGR